MWRIEQIEKEPSSRCAHQAEIINDYMYIFGGWNDENLMLNDIHRFNSVTWEWEQLNVDTAESCFVVPRNGHTMNAYGKQLIVFGGGSFSGFLNDILSFSLENCKWSAIQTAANTVVPCGRSKHSSCLVDDRLYIFGGGDGIRLYNDMFYLDLVQWRWYQVDCSNVSQKPSPRWGHTMVKLPDNKSLLLFGGHAGSKRLNDLYIFNIEESTWHQVQYSLNEGDLVPPPRAGHTATMIGQHMLLFGGGDGKIINDCYLLDTIDFKWWKFNNIPPEGRCAHSTLFHNNKLIIYGGGNGVQCLRKLIVLDSLDQIDNLYNQFKDLKSPSNNNNNNNNNNNIVNSPNNNNQIQIKKIKNQIEDLNLSLSQLSNTIELKAKKIQEQKEQQQQQNNIKVNNNNNVDIDKFNKSRLNDYEKRDIIYFLNQIGMSKFINKFIEEEIDTTVVHLLTEDHLKELGIQSLGDRLSIIKGIRESTLYCFKGKSRLSMEYDPNQLVKFIDDDD
ncbi:Kelch repeat-containing protein [Tieghemostelium lacteum]|uniref:Kelch repeat-containing protein n=1 Tax=Tieghemostelium lacteum TaxID=361077 RepID=A0A151ZHX9_TIELA|nr:Kelch repeat-containing protein [Tieghemostelium lacteum]|eukprot:KYQ93592.1 Kelch repeat-containing protein [Tieghemostelium lacteum]